MTNSAESMVGPLPVSVLGVAWFVVFLALVATRHRAPAGRVVNLQLAWSIAGLLTVFYLVYAELFLVGAICLWCTAVHAIVVALFLSSLWDATAVT